MHEHPASIVVFLNDSQVKFTLPDAKSMDGGGKAGDVRFAEAGTHLPENVGGKPVEAVLIELKGEATNASTAVALDAVKIDPEHHKVEFENERVRVLRINFKPHDKTKEHEHPNGVAVFLTDTHTRFMLADGKTREARGKRGDATLAAAEKHAAENLSDKPAEIILVELKR